MSYYHLLDQPDILQRAFVFRRGLSPCPPDAFDLHVPVGTDISLHCRVYSGSTDFPTILYFHGRERIVSDYDEIAPLYLNGAGVNLAVAEFRGYGDVGGNPTFSAMLEDAYRYLAALREELERRRYCGSLFVMGRSMGSVSALELAAAGTVENDGIKGLIIESGFTTAGRILRPFNIEVPQQTLTLMEIECRQKVQRITMPALVIHGELDDLVPLVEAETLYSLLGSEYKELVTFQRADHRLLQHLRVEDEEKTKYISAIRRFVQQKTLPLLF